jgi:protein involved in polysaccharide export with SLBB domain
MEADVKNKVIRFLMLLALLSVAEVASAQNAPTTDLTLRPGDVLQIGVWPSAELGGQFVVEEGGLVYLPFLGAVRVTGMSMAQLRAELTAGYSRALQNPVITITPLFRVGVMGAVNRPGIYLVPTSDQLFEVIGTAGGFAANANPSKVEIVRDGQVVSLDTQQALDTGDLLPLRALQLRSGDMIVVDRRSPITAGSVLAAINVVLATALLIDRIVND